MCLTVHYALTLKQTHLTSRCKGISLWSGLTDWEPLDSNLIDMISVYVNKFSFNLFFLPPTTFVKWLNVCFCLLLPKTFGYALVMASSFTYKQYLNLVCIQRSLAWDGCICNEYLEVFVLSSTYYHRGRASWYIIMDHIKIFWTVLMYCFYSKFDLYWA